MPLFFPPFRAGQSRCAPLDSARQGHGRAAYFRKCPFRFDTHIHVHAPRTAGLGLAAKTHFFEKPLHFE